MHSYYATFLTAPLFRTSAATIPSLFDITHPEIPDPSICEHDSPSTLNALPTFYPLTLTYPSMPSSISLYMLMHVCIYNMCCVYSVCQLHRLCVHTHLEALTQNIICKGIEHILFC